MKEQVPVKGLEGIKEKYDIMEFDPLIVTAVYKPGASRQAYSPNILDNLLANRVLMKYAKPSDYPRTSENWEIPIPVKVLWRNKCEWPLYAASCFWPESETHKWQFIHHERAIGGQWTKSNAKDHRLIIHKSHGPHKEKRMPVPAETSLTGRYSARCIGNADEIADLLSTVMQLSARRSMGLGEIDHWEIVPADFGSHDTITDGEMFLRTWPYDARELLLFTPTTPPVMSVGWTPPQWHPAMFSAGWREGTPI
jgi:hypothetical protein